MQLVAKVFIHLLAVICILYLWENETVQAKEYKNTNWQTVSYINNFIKFKKNVSSVVQ